MNLTRVTKTTIREITARLNNIDTLVFDIESTGLKAYHESKLFSLAISDLDGNGYYFNFKPYKDLDEEFVLEPGDVLGIMSRSRTWIAHNAKFDLHFCDRAGIRPIGEVYDTEVLARLYQNNHQFTRGGYSLATCCERWLSVRKDDRVKAWMDDNGAYSVYPNAEGRDQKHYYFDLVPFEMISEYAVQDAIVTGRLYTFLRENMYETQLIKVETDLIPVLFEMERTGIKIDRHYCETAYEFEKGRIDGYEYQVKAIVGPDFMDSAKFLAPLLEARGFTLPETEKGNPQVTDQVLSQKPDDELALALLGLRDAQKRATTYWSNYLFLADADDTIHPNFRQSGTVTGRMSCNNPNLQNIPSEDDGPYPVRRAFIARPGFIFVSADFKAMEFRLMLDYAQEQGLIEKIKAGHDPHQATADLTGLDRKAAKTLNFGILYGMGVAKLAQAIGVSPDEAKRFKYRYFDALPGVQRFIYESKRRMEARGYTFDWAGRRFILDDPKWSYKAVNSIIQGGSASICKLAMVNLRDRLRSMQSRMVLQVHDEIVFEIHTSEIDVIRDALLIMESAYPARSMPMGCSIAWGRNLHDLTDVESVDEISV